MSDQTDKERARETWGKGFSDEIFDLVWKEHQLLKIEEVLSMSILQRNRFRTCPPYDWFGPAPEPKFDSKDEKLDFIASTLNISRSKLVGDEG